MAHPKSSTARQYSASRNLTFSLLTLIFCLFSSGIFSELRANSLFDGFNSNPKFLPVEQALPLSIDETNPSRLSLTWELPDGYYLYKDKITVEVIDGKGDIGPIVWPKSDIHHDEFFGDVAVFRGHTEIQVPIQFNDATTTAEVEIGYQGCADAGLCYPPIKRRITLIPTPNDTTQNTPEETTSPSPKKLSEQDQLSQQLTSDSALSTLLIFFGLGILLAFTPCVLPMVPILSGIILGSDSQNARWRGFFLSVVYVLAMSIAYTVAGVLAGLSGNNLQALFQQPWIIIAFSTLFVLLSLSLFGFYRLQIPSFIQAKIHQISGSQKSGQYVGAAVMGVLSALIVGPCVAPPLVAALMVVSQHGDPLLGGAALFMLSMGMGVPLIILGASSSHWLPKAGAWMETINRFFGVLLIALAIWMLERILPATWSLYLWGSWLVFSAVYLAGLSSGKPRSGWDQLRWGAALLLLFYGLLVIIGAASGGKQLFQPLQHLASNSNSGASNNGHSQSLPFIPSSTLAALNHQQQLAKNQSQYLMLDFYADWCVSCKQMERNTFSSAQVRQKLDSFRLLQADVTDYTDEHQTLMKHVKVVGPPSILFFSPDGQELSNARLVGYMGPEQFLKHLNTITQ